MRARVEAAARSMLAAVIADSALRGIRARVVPDAPSTLPALLAAVEVDAVGMVVPVSGEHSASAVFGPDGNARVRAWHDAEHADGRLPFTLAGEVEASRRAVARLRALGASPDALFLADVEVRGQTLHRARHGAFPSDQGAFARLAFRHGLGAAVERGS